MKNICMYFQVHQPLRLKRYRFFDIGSDHYYYDDYSNESILRKVAEKCYLPANRRLMEIIRKHEGKVKISLSFSGMVLEQFALYGEDVLASFKQLIDTGAVEVLAETWAHSLAFFRSEDEFRRQVKLHEDALNKYFGVKPKVFRNTELIYSDEIGKVIADMGYTGMLTEGAKHVLGWKSPNHMYCNVLNPKLKVLTRNFKLSDDIAFRFSNRSWNEWPLTAKKYVDWIKALPEDEEIINVFMDYETFGEHQWEETGIFKFMEELPAEVLKNEGLDFSTPSAIMEHKPVSSALEVPNPISWADEEKDLTAWLGNELQEEAYNKLYDIEGMVKQCKNPDILRDWTNLQASDHFYYMCTKFFSDGEVHAYFSPFDSPYDAFINYMNILSDFILRIKAAMPAESDVNGNGLGMIVNTQAKEIDKLKKQIERLKKKEEPKAPKKARTKKTAATKTASKTNKKSTSGRKKGTAKQKSK